MKISIIQYKHVRNTKDIKNGPKNTSFVWVTTVKLRDSTFSE